MSVSFSAYAQIVLCDTQLIKHELKRDFQT